MEEELQSNDLEPPGKDHPAWAPLETLRDYLQNKRTVASCTIAGL
jgi:hypothetical protein